MTEKVIMPSELTAENGAKKLLIGDFYEEITTPCPHCFNEDPEDSDCQECDGRAEFHERVYVSWSTIKEIYKKAVEGLSIDSTDC